MISAVSPVQPSLLNPKIVPPKSVSYISLASLVRECIGKSESDDDNDSIK
jgi:hypothetical protein